MEVIIIIIKHVDLEDLLVIGEFPGEKTIKELAPHPAHNPKSIVAFTTVSLHPAIFPSPSL